MCFFPTHYFFLSLLTHRTHSHCTYSHRTHSLRTLTHRSHAHRTHNVLCSTPCSSCRSFFRAEARARGPVVLWPIWQGLQGRRASVVHLQRPRCPFHEHCPWIQSPFSCTCTSPLLPFPPSPLFLLSANSGCIALGCNGMQDAVY